MSHNDIFLQKTQISNTRYPYILGGKSPYWVGWFVKPTLNEISDQSEEIIDNHINYLDECEKILNLHTTKKPERIDEKFKKYSKEVQISMLHNGHCVK
jgi:hypothetical protein